MIPVTRLTGFDTSEIRDVVVLLQHGQGGGVQVQRQACTAPWWCGRVLANAATTTTAPFSPTRVVRREGGRIPAPGGGVLKATGEAWGQREGTGVPGLAGEVHLWSWTSGQIT